MTGKLKRKQTKRAIIVRNALVTVGLLAAATVLSAPLVYLTSASSANVALLYILSISLIGRYTDGYMSGIIASVVGVICVNYLYTYPYFALNFTISGYPVTFLLMLTISMITCAATSRFKKQAYALAEKEKLVAEGEKEKMRVTLLRAISHDLRTPLTSIIGASSSLTNPDMELTEQEKRQMAVNIQEDASWLRNMVENILSVTRIQDDSTQLKKTPEALEEVMTEAVFRLKKRRPEAEIVTQISSQLVMINVDALLIEQVMINLLENAVIHAHSTRPIEFFATLEKKGIAIHVRDYGIGIQVEPYDRVFDFYTRGGTDDADGEKGFGLGLSICKTIVEAHGGEIHAFNHKDGSEFYFIIPEEGA